MRISGTEPLYHQWSLAPKKQFEKLEVMPYKCQIKLNPSEMV